jgi:hypothetical protein
MCGASHPRAIVRLAHFDLSCADWIGFDVQGVVNWACTHFPILSSGAVMTRELNRME